MVKNMHNYVQAICCIQHEHHYTTFGNLLPFLHVIDDEQISRKVYFLYHCAN